MRFITLIFFALLILNCTGYNFTREIEAENFALVRKEFYQDWTYADPTGGEYQKLVQRWRQIIESKPQLLRKIVGKYFSLPVDAQFEFKFASSDSLKKSLALRYFTPIQNHPEIAGYQVYFVFELRTQKIKAVYTSEVPLE